MSRARVTSPPTRLTPAALASSVSPAANSSAQLSSRLGGAENPTTSAVARAPMASRSETLTATALRPTSRAGDQSRRKCTPSTSTSSEVTTGGCEASTAPSSPGPTSTSGPERQPGGDLRDQRELAEAAERRRPLLTGRSTTAVTGGQRCSVTHIGERSGLRTWLSLISSCG